LFLFVLFSAVSTKAQTAPGSRITQPVDDHVRVTLKGNVHPLAQSQFDQGAVPDAFPVERMLLILQRPPDRESASLGGQGFSPGVTRSKAVGL
jgi:hypothetical protein